MNTHKTKERKSSGSKKPQSCGQMDARVVKMLVGDEIARIAQRCEPILGRSAGDVGEMIAEELACQFQDFRNQLLIRLVDKERDTTSEQLAKRWVDWRSTRNKEKASVSDSKRPSDDDRETGAVGSVKPASPFDSPRTTSALSSSGDRPSDVGSLTTGRAGSPAAESSVQLPDDRKAASAQAGSQQAATPDGDR